MYTIVISRKADTIQHLELNHSNLKRAINTAASLLLLQLRGSRRQPISIGIHDSHGVLIATIEA